MSPVRPYEDAPVQDSQRLLHSALREARFLGDLAVTQLYRLLPFADRAAPQQQVHDKGRGTVVMAYQVLQQHIHNVVVEPEGSHGYSS